MASKNEEAPKVSKERTQKLTRRLRKFFSSKRVTDQNPSEDKKSPATPEPPNQKPLTSKSARDVAPAHDPNADDSDTISEDLDVIITEESREYISKIAVGKLRKIGCYRPLWLTKFSSYFVVLSFLLSYDVLVQFAVHLHNYGVVFTFAYCVVIVMVGFPLMYLELALGQYTSSTSFHIFDRIAPGFAGIGMASLAFNLWKMISDQMVVVSFSNILAKSINMFTSEMPWHSCHLWYNDEHCHQLMRECDEYNKQVEGLDNSILKEIGNYYHNIGDICFKSMLRPVQKAFESPNLLESLESGREFNYDVWFRNEAMGQFLWWNTDFETRKTVDYPEGSFYVIMTITWGTVIFIALSRNTMVVYTSVTGVVLMLSVLTANIIGFIFLVKPDFPYMDATSKAIKSEYLSKPEIWIDSFFLTLSALKIGQGGLTYLGAQNKFTNNIVTDSFIYVIIMTVVPFVYSLSHILSIDSFLLWAVRGDMEKWAATTEKLNDPDSSYLYSTGNQLIHLLVLVQSYRIYKHIEPVALCFFSGMGMIMVITNTVIRLEILVAAVLEAFPLMSSRSSRSMVVSTIVLSGAMGTLLFKTTSGLELLVAMDDVVYPMLAVCIAFCQMLVVLCTYYPQRLFANISCMLNRESTQDIHTRVNEAINFAIGILWVITPLLCLIAFFYRIFGTGFKAHQSSILDFPVLLTIAILVIIPIVFFNRLVVVITEQYNVKCLFRTDPELWGARSKIDRDRAEKMEKQMRW